MTIKDANLLSFINKFFKEFMGYAIFFFIGFFLDYDQVKLVKKSQDLTVFIILLDPIQMTTLL